MCKWIICIYFLVIIAKGFTKEELHLGGFFSMTGKNAVEGRGINPAVQLAVKHINNWNSILEDYTLQVIPVDTKSETMMTIKECINLTSTDPKIVALIGDLSTDISVALGELGRWWNLVTISYTSISKAVTKDTERFPYLISLRAPISSLDYARIAFTKYFNWTTVGILQENEILYTNAIEQLKKSLIKSNITITTAEVFFKTMKIEMKRLKDTSSRIIFGYFSVANIKKVFCEAYKIGLMPPKYVWILQGAPLLWWKGNETLQNCTYEEILSAAQGHILIDDDHSQNKNLKTDWNMTHLEFQDQYRDLLKMDNTRKYSWASLVYDAIWAIAYGLNNTDKLLNIPEMYQTEEMANAIYNSTLNISFQGLTGIVQFDNTGVRKGSAEIKQFKGESYQNHGIISLSEKIIWQKQLEWMDGKVPLDKLQLVAVQIVISPILFYAVVAISSIGIIFASGFLAFNIVKQNTRLIKMSSPNLNNLVVFGCLLAYISTVLYGMDSRLISDALFPVMCQLRLWTLTLGFTLAFGSLFAKTWRVHKVFANRGARKVHIKDTHLFGVILGLLMIDFIILITWLFVEPMQFQLKELPKQIDENYDRIIIPTFGRCTCLHSMIWQGVLYTFKGILLLFGVFLAWETRKVNYSALNDSRQVGLAVYNVVILCIVGVPTSMFIAESNKNVIYAITSMCTIISTTFTLCIVFVPKIIDFKGNRINLEGTVHENSVSGSHSDYSSKFHHVSGSCQKAEVEIIRIRTELEEMKQKMSEKSSVLEQ